MGLHVPFSLFLVGLPTHICFYLAFLFVCVTKIYRVPNKLSKNNFLIMLLDNDRERRESKHRLVNLTEVHLTGTFVA